MASLRVPQNERYNDIEQLQKKYSPYVSDSGLYSSLAILQPIRRPIISEDRLFPYKDAIPCESCKAITLKALLSANGYQHHSIALATIAAENGCKICDIILQGFAVFGRMKNEDDMDYEHEPIILTLANSTGTPYCQDELWATTENRTAILGLYTDEGNIASNWLPGRRLARNLDLDAAIEIIKEWMQRSLTRSQEYINEPKDVPKRLIDVSQGDGSIIYLKDFSQTSAHGVNLKDFYICMSHKWDSITSLHTTTTTNFSTRVRGISTNSLPQTFRDVIYITRGLGLRYIWIDSLCILQDSVQDWEEESAKMGKYYHSSWLTIGVGIESTKGLFTTRDKAIDKFLYYKLLLHTSEQWVLYFTEDRTTISMGDDQKSILRQRAWAFQEEVLSPRYLGFQQNQMFYRCGDYIDFEDGHLEWLYAPSPSRSVSDTPLQESDMSYDNWFDFVECYSSRALTVDEDRLPALSGIAHSFESMLKGKYLAGLWKEGLPGQLCWTKEYAQEPCIGSSQYRAPSWSWAAINGRASMVSGINCFSHVFEVKIIHASVDPLGLDPLGAVKGGVLKLVGVIRLGIRVKDSPSTNSSDTESSDYYSQQRYTIRKSTFFLLGTNGGIDCETTYSFIPDTSDFCDSIEKLWFLNITSQVGLALLPRPSSAFPKPENTFERVGLIEVHEWQRSKVMSVRLDSSLPRQLVNII